MTIVHEKTPPVNQRTRMQALLNEADLSWFARRSAAGAEEGPV